MGAPTQVTSLYRDALGGLHEIPQVATTNAMGQTVMSSGIQYTTPSKSSSSIFSTPSSGGSGTPVAPKPTAADFYQKAIDTAQTGVDSAKQAASRVQDRITNTSLDLDAARAAAGGMTDAITNVNKSAYALNPYISSITGAGNDLMSIYNQLIGGDTTKGGAVADYLNSTRDAADALLKVNPDDYVASAASDAQASAQNAQGQTMREMARRGVNVGSGAYATLRDQMSRAQSVLLAATKTAARRQGLQDQIAALTQRAGLFKDVIGTAQSVGQQGTTDLAAAAGIVQKQGDMFATAGSMAAQQSNAFANIGGVEINLGQLDLQSEGVVQDAISNVTAMQQAMAQFYKDTMTQMTNQRNPDGTYTYTTTSYS